MTGLKAVIVFILMVEGIGTLALPMSDTTAEKFKTLLEPNTDRKCTFPPAIALSADKLQLCLENTNQEDRPTAKTVCENILELTDLVCSLQNFLIPVIDVMIIVKDTQNDLCSRVEIQHIFTKEKCSDIIESESAFHTVSLYSAMLRGLFKTFAGNNNLSALHNVIQHLQNYFPFPPHGSEDKGYYLAKCENDSVPEPTHGLCLLIRDLATEYASNHWFGAIDETAMYLNVTEGTWDPCPVLAKWNESNKLFKDKCNNSCEGENGVICRSLAYGYISRPAQETAKTQSFPTQTVEPAPEKHVTPISPDERLEGSQNVITKPSGDNLDPENPKDNPGKTTEVSPGPGKASVVILDPTKVPEVILGPSKATEVSLVSSKAPGVDMDPIEETVNSTIPSKELESSPDAGKEHNGTIPDVKKPEDQSVNVARPTLSSEEENKDQGDQKSSGEIQEKNDAGQTDLLDDNDEDLTTKATLVPSASVNTDQETSPGVTSNMSGVDESVNDELSGFEDNDKTDFGTAAGKMYGNLKADSKPLDSQITQDDTGESGGISFMSYFLVFVVLCVAGYILFHNKQKIIALVIEGKNTQHGRRPSSKDYSRLKTDDVMPSLEKSASSSNYVY